MRCGASIQTFLIPETPSGLYRPCVIRIHNFGPEEGLIDPMQGINKSKSLPDPFRKKPEHGKTKGIFDRLVLQAVKFQPTQADALEPPFRGFLLPVNGWCWIQKVHRDARRGAERQKTLPHLAGEWGGSTGQDVPDIITGRSVRRGCAGRRRPGPQVRRGCPCASRAGRRNRLRAWRCPARAARAGRGQCGLFPRASRDRRS